MLDALLKSKFFCKCKSDIKLTRTRIDMIKKKRNATQKYLRNDILDLLKNGLDINAYGRAEGLIVEMNKSQCYELIDQYCEHILKNLAALDKQRECPEECREAASSLMFAAARFADLPELRELRTIFSERYGNSLDFYHKQFAEKLKSNPPSKDVKLRLLQEIAAESGLEWNSKALENKLFSESAYDKDFATETDDREYSLHDHVDDSVQKKDSTGGGYGYYQYAKEFNPETKNNLPYYEQSEATRKEGEIGPPIKDIEVDTIVRTTKKSDERASIQKVPSEEDDDKPLKYTSIPPPYTKSEVNKAKDKVEPTEPADSEENHEHGDPVVLAKPARKSVRTRNPRPQPGQEVAGGYEKEKLEETNKEKAALGQRILKFFDGGDDDQRDEEEKVMDKLLQRYSRKKGLHRKGKSDSTLQDNEEHRNRDGPNRVSSLPVESRNPTETPTTHTRASSFHQDPLNANRHVHPKLPDYDEFVARLAAFRGK